MNEQIPGKKLAKILLKRIFTSNVISTIVNIMFPIILSIYSSTYNNSVTYKWYIGLCLGFIVLFVYNVTFGIITTKEKKYRGYLNLLIKCYYEQNSINKLSAIKIYRMEKIIKTHLDKRMPVNRIVFEKIADFNTIAFDICNSIYNIISSEYGIDTCCEVTIFRRFDEQIKMVAFATETKTPPSSYNNKYKLNSKQSKYCFVDIFKRGSDKIVCCANNKEVLDKFTLLEKSEEREKKDMSIHWNPIKNRSK